MTNSETKNWANNGNLRTLLTGLAVIILVAGWASTWTALSKQVASNESCITRLETNKLEINVYRSDLRRLEEKIDLINRNLEHWQKNTLAPNG